MTENAQKIMIYWGLAFMYIFGFTVWGLLKMMPPPDANLSEQAVGLFYQQNSFDIRLGAMISSWTSAFMVPFSAAAAIQLARLEKGTPAWSILAFAGGIMMSIFLVLPPLFWGVAAFTVERAPEVTTLMHELGMLTLVTTDQFFIFQMIPMAYVSLTRTHDSQSGFPRWLGYLTLWIAIIFEVGALAFMFKAGPFSWNGIFVFWFPLVTFGFWVTVTSFHLLRALSRQQAEKNALLT